MFWETKPSPLNLSTRVFEIAHAADQSTGQTKCRVEGARGLHSYRRVSVTFQLIELWCCYRFLAASLLLNVTKLFQ